MPSRIAISRLPNISPSPFIVVIFLSIAGLLYNNNLILYDRNTESLWSQIINQSINGSLKKISSKHVDDTMKLIMSRTSGESIDLPDRIRVFKQSKSLFIKKESVPLRELGEKRKNQRNI